MIKVVDDFLPKDEFDFIRNNVFNQQFPLYLQDEIVDNEKRCITHINFSHNIYANNVSLSPFFDTVNQLLFSKLDMRSLIRSKINCYPRTDKIIQHTWHIDFEYEHKGILYYLNTCDGETRFKGENSVKSKENRAVFFNPSKLHASTSCTDDKCRWSIIANYL